MVDRKCTEALPGPFSDFSDGPRNEARFEAEVELRTRASPRYFFVLPRDKRSPPTIALGHGESYLELPNINSIS